MPLVRQLPPTPHHSTSVLEMMAGGNAALLKQASWQLQACVISGMMTCQCQSLNSVSPSVRQAVQSSPVQSSPLSDRNGSHAEDGPGRSK